MTSPSDEDELLTEYYREQSEPMRQDDRPDWPWLWGPNKARNAASCENADDPYSTGHNYEYTVTRTKIDKDRYTVYKCRVCQQQKFILVT